MERKDVHDLPYRVNKLGEVRSKEMVIKCNNRRGGQSTHVRPPKKLKYDRSNGVKENKHHARVQLYNNEGGRKCFFVARLIYALFLGVEYNLLTYVHYKDGDSHNLRFENLIHSRSGILRK